MASLSDNELRRNAREIAEAKLGFYIHLSAYAIVNSLIFMGWWFSGAVYVWIFPWFVFPLFGWGAGILVHYICVFPTPHSGYIESKAEQEYQKLKNAQQERRQEETATA